MMKSRGLVLLVILGVALVAVKMMSGEKMEEKGTRINWVPFSTGMAQAKSENKPLFLYFHADWCGYCKKMEKETFRDRSVKACLDAGFVSIKVDFDTQKALAKKLGVRGLPTIFILDARGRTSGPIPGFISAKQLLKLLEKA